MNQPPYDARYLEGVRHFNECDFFEAHESWEELWTDYQGPSRKFYQGLIQVAVCFHHFGNGNTRGAIKLYHTSRAYLEPFRPHHEGVNVEKLLDEMAVCCRDLLAADAKFPAVAIVPDLIPEIHLDPPPPG
jgi:predicted metal-dependent hydrolase